MTAWELAIRNLKFKVTLTPPPVRPPKVCSRCDSEKSGDSFPSGRNVCYVCVNKARAERKANAS